jgi:cell division inhibitor SulA
MDNTFNERGVMITRNGLSAGGQIFSLREIQSARVETIQKNKVLPLTLSLSGAAVAVAGGMSTSGAALTLGAMSIVVGFLAWTTQDIRHRLTVSTQSGDREALTSPDPDFVKRVEQALQTALASIQSTATQ